MRGWIKQAVNTYLEAKSFTTNRKLIIIESDDWGSLRTKDKPTRSRLNAINSAVNQDKYCQLDSIATEQDLELLFEVLGYVKDKNNNPACLTPNVCTANPDFEKIKADDFKHFYYLPFTETLKSYSSNLFELWQDGIQQNVFKPQLHGREHLHALAWLEELRAGHQDLHKAFELEAWGIPYKAGLKQKRNNLQAALDCYGLENENEYQQQWIEDAASIFKNSFGYPASSFIAPAFTWHKNIHKHLAKTKIKSIQGIKLQYQPKLKQFKGYTKLPRYTGQPVKPTQMFYTVRNAFFEPFLNPDKDWVNTCMGEIKLAFSKNQPAIIGSHRINFVGRLDETHRDKNLKQFKKLLNQIQKHFPGVEFIDSGTLIEIIKKDI